MERPMESNKHERFFSANKELRNFLQRVEGVASGTCSFTEGDLNTLSQRLTNLAPEIGDASRGETLDAVLRNEIAEYVMNLRALQTALEKIRCFMLSRKMQLETRHRRLNGLQGWVNAYR
jgi:hypothetical protein